MICLNHYKQINTVNSAPPQEVLRHAPDLVCLQEVDHPRLLSRALAAAGYSGRHLHKPDSPCLYLPHNNGPDGCALFYNAAKFELISWATRVLRVWDVPSNQVGGSCRHLLVSS